MPPTFKISCPNCAATLEIPLGFETVVCRSCGGAYHVRQFTDSVSLSRASGNASEVDDDLTRPGSNGSANQSTGRSYLAELDEEILELGLQVEDLKSREKGAPLRAGCAFFGAFFVVVLVLGTFATVGRSYFNGWFFYVVLAGAVVVCLWRLRSKLFSSADLRALRLRRIDTEEVLAQVEAERKRVQDDLK
jgi:hypothetical protein